MSHSQLPFDKPVSPSDMAALLASWAGNLQRNTTNAFHSLNPADYIRLITIICGYLLLRPYLVKVGAYVQEKDHARKNEPFELGGDGDGRGKGGGGSKALDSSGQRRSRSAIPGVESDSEEDDEGPAAGVDWGRRARLRQRKVVREALARHERQLQELQQTESDKEIEDLLIDD